MAKKNETNKVVESEASNETVVSPQESPECPACSCSLEQLWEKSSDDFKQALVEYVATHPFFDAYVKKAMEPVRFSIVNFQRHLNELSWRFDQLLSQKERK